MQEKTYVYDARRFMRDVTFTGWFCAAALVVSVVLAAMQVMVALMCVVAAVSLYTVWNTFVAHAYPREVRVSDAEISFSYGGRTDGYELADIKEFSVRELPAQRTSFVRIDGGGLVRRRYWVRCQWFSDGEELFQRLSDLECRINPESLKARARMSSIEASRAKKARDAKRG